MKRLLLITIFVVIKTSCFAQIRLQGFVKDSLGNPIELANIVAINQATNSLHSYSISNNKGYYKLKLSKNASYIINVSYIGMVKISDTLTTGETEIKKDFTLKQNNLLDEVEIISKMPVTFSGDTLVYSVDYFKDGSERKLKDILKKLPGIEVSDSGEVGVDGKKVSKVMVEGKDFFDGDSKLATENIPADAVDKVQVLRNYSEVDQLSGVINNQDNIAINIKLKEGKKKFWFGSIAGGEGLANENNLYLLKPRLFYYNPSYSINILGDVNNISELSLTRDDYRTFTGGLNSPSRRSGTSISLVNDAPNFLSFRDNNAKDVTTKFGAVNFSFSPNEVLDISGFGIFNKNNVSLMQDVNIAYVESIIGIPNENIITQTNQRSKLDLLKFSTKFKPNSNNQLDYDILANITSESQESNNTSSVIGNVIQINEFTPYSINQNLNYYYTLNQSNIFAFELQHLLKNENPFYKAILEKPASSEEDRYLTTAIDLGLNLNQGKYNINQNKQIKSNKIDTKLDYWNVINNKSNINFTLGTIHSIQKFDSNFFQLLDDNSALETTPIINDGKNKNNVNYTFNDFYLGFHYTLKAGIFTFMPGFTAHTYKINNNQYGADFNSNFTSFLPDFNLDVKISRNSKINLNYNMLNEFTDVTKLSEALVLNNYNYVLTGNRMLDSAFMHSFNLNYSSFNTFNHSFIFAFFDYRKTAKKISSSIILEPGRLTNIGSFFNNSNSENETLFAMARYTKKFGKIKASLNGSFTFYNYNILNNDVKVINSSYNQVYDFTVRTAFREFPNLGIRYKYDIQENLVGKNKAKFHIKSPTIELDAYLLKSFTFKSDYTFNSFNNENGINNKFFIWNASISFRSKETSKFEYKLQATNLQNTKSFRKGFGSQISFIDTEYFIQPRYLTFRLIYNI